MSHPLVSATVTLTPDANYHPALLSATTATAAVIMTQRDGHAPLSLGGTSAELRRLANALMAAAGDADRAAAEVSR